MKLKSIFSIVIIASVVLVSSCTKNEDPTPTGTSKTAVIQNYAAIVLQSYKDALSDAQALETAITTLTTTPSEVNFNAAKAAWKTARESYGPTEAYRFANGPIDMNDDAPEGLLNSWPLDENYIDYVVGAPNSGIINDAATFPNINKATLLGANQSGDVEKNVAIGYHAIEFLLWGQDTTLPSAKEAGKRAYTDYTTATNATRRGEYLKVVADLLTDHLQALVNAWEGNYKTTFLALPVDEALTNMFKGIAILTKGELSGERVFVAYDNQDQEDEHSCFSDNTDRDIRLNLAGIVNVFKGNYKNISGASLENLITEADAVKGTAITTAINKAVSAIDATASPFDFAISDPTERVKVLASVNALNDLGDAFVVGASAINLQISANLPD